MANTTSAQSIERQWGRLSENGSNVVIISILAVNETRILISEIN